MQSNHWTNADGFINVTRADGSTYRSKPQNIGLEGELYTRFDESGESDIQIEKWFGAEIEGPFTQVFGYLHDESIYRREPFPQRPPSHEIERYRQCGFVFTNAFEYAPLSKTLRAALARYLGALLVRNPRYLRKLEAFHRDANAEVLDLTQPNQLKTVALDNMMQLFSIYTEAIYKSALMLVRIEGDREFIFPDSGITAQEPWGRGALPFTIHAPLTPKMAIEVLPADARTPSDLIVSRVSATGVARSNRIALAGAERFVFTKGTPPVEFIMKNFGKSPPAPFGYRVVDGRGEAIYDASRDR